MEGLPALWLGALIVGAALVVIVAGAWIARTGDEFAERTGLGRVFVGALLIAGATSLPELGTGITAAVSGAPDLAVGGLFGESMANMAILAVIDLSYRGRLFLAVELSHTRLAAVAIGLTALAVMAIATPGGWPIASVGSATIGIAAIYAAALVWFRRVPSLGSIRADETPFRRVQHRRVRRRPARTVRRLVLEFAAGAALLFAAAPMLALSTEEFSHRSGIDQSVLGVTILAISTALPELASTVAAMRIGAFDLAVGNLLGSNAANMAMLVVIDAAYRPGPILGAVDEGLVVAGTASILLMALALASLVSGQVNRASRFEPDSAVLLVAYVASLVAVAAV